MPRRLTEQQLFDELLDRYGLRIADAFQAAIDDLRSAADLQRVIAAVEAGNISAAIDALHLDPAAYNSLLDTIRETYTTGGQTAVSYMPAVQGVAIRFDVRNFAAEQWLKNHSSTLVTRILDDQRNAVRHALALGMARGANPTTTALDIVGRIDKATGTRQGGLLGLTAQQSSYVENARQELSSGDPEALRSYMGRTLRDKRFDRTIQKAINDGTPVPADIQSKAVRQYGNRLLKLRGDMIGRTESLTALRASKHEAYRQAIASGAISEGAVRRTWRSAGDPRVRHTHQVMNGETVGFSEPFRSPSGARMMFPGDFSLGAGPAETVNCRCDTFYRIDFLANLT
jgi:hypothetical protein